MKENKTNCSKILYLKIAGNGVKEKESKRDKDKDKDVISAIHCSPGSTSKCIEKYLFYRNFFPGLFI